MVRANSNLSNTNKIQIYLKHLLEISDIVYKPMKNEEICYTLKYLKYKLTSVCHGIDTDPVLNLL